VSILAEARQPKPLRPGLRSDPLWYRNAVIYQLHVRSFNDSNGDGIGDFQGLISRLDYLQELGVTAVWLLPFYPSPLKDDGYDIADYTSVNPSYGNIDDVRQFIQEAHRRRIRVITELVINHTSDQHPWFQRARRAPKGSPERDFYVWSDDPEKYQGVRIIFKDFERSNWSWDPVANQYYWHRFFHHQPDLNFDNPAVHQAVFEAMEFWLEMGVDGLRLDAVPYLYEREGTSCENLEETHAFLRKLRSHIDQHYPGRMLLAEANQWPEDAVAYFGKGEGDECHMNFHFPLMPRLFMSLRMEDRFPIIDILEQTPAVPGTGQWAMFLRNHDELTLEMVTDEERDYMWRVYASDPAARINLGIRRRLAPLLDNSRRRIELMNALLFSMPGSPIIYYGDEIGMGDNIYLGDRNGVRTPMQWSADRNAGFSRGNPQRLLLPVIIDPEYHYETVNVESQLSSPSSLLWWMRRLIALRRRHPVFGRGAIKFLTPSNSKVLAFVRQDEDERVLCVANLSRFSQPVELDLSDYAACCTPVEMFGNVAFPPIGSDGKYTLALSPHGFYWFLLQPNEGGGVGGGADEQEIQLDVPGRGLLNEDAFEHELEAVLPRLLPARRWFVSKARTIGRAKVIERLPIGAEAADAEPVQRALFLVHVEYTEGEPETYALPLAVRPASDRVTAQSMLRVVDGDGQAWSVEDGMTDEVFARGLLRLATQGGGVAGEMTRLVGRRVGRQTFDAASLAARLPEREQSNTNVVFGDQFILKLYRRLGEGTNPELEIGEHLTRVGYPQTAPLHGALELVNRAGGPARTLGVALGFVPHEDDAWSLFLDHGQRYTESLEALTAEQVAALPMPPDGWAYAAEAAVPTDVATLLADPLAHVRLLGQRSAEMHAAMADDRGDEAFRPEPYTGPYQRSLLQSMRNTLRATMQTVGQRIAQLPEATAASARRLLGREGELLASFRRIVDRPVRASRIRLHGDYHLGQVLWTGKDFVIIDFEGEPLRSVGERRLKRSPLRDVAGMLRSFDYAAWTALRQHWELLPPAGRPGVAERGIAGAALWGAWLGAEFVRAYVATARAARPDLLPPDAADTDLVLRTWLMEKALYEVRYELNSRPDWVEIPLRAVHQLLDEGTAAGTATAATDAAATPGGNGSETSEGAVR
jgi:maltose alpha-D-glucosyltransferase/alpha-amylase